MSKTFQANCGSLRHPGVETWTCKRRATEQRAQEDLRQHLERYPDHKGAAGVLPTAGLAEDGPCDLQDEDG